jgi:hypothetical protein
MSDQQASDGSAASLSPATTSAAGSRSAWVLAPLPAMSAELAAAKAGASAYYFAHIAAGGVSASAALPDAPGLSRHPCGGDGAACAGSPLGACSTPALASSAASGAALPRPPAAFLSSVSSASSPAPPPVRLRVLSPSHAELAQLAQTVMAQRIDSTTMNDVIRTMAAEFPGYMFNADELKFIKTEVINAMRISNQAAAAARGGGGSGGGARGGARHRAASSSSDDEGGDAGGDDDDPGDEAREVAKTPIEVGIAAEKAALAAGVSAAVPLPAHPSMSAELAVLNATVCTVLASNGPAGEEKRPHSGLSRTSPGEGCCCPAQGEQLASRSFPARISGARAVVQLPAHRHCTLA